MTPSNNPYALLDDAPLKALARMRVLPAADNKDLLIAQLMAQDMITESHDVETDIVYGRHLDGGWQTVGVGKKGKKKKALTTEDEAAVEPKEAVVVQQVPAGCTEDKPAPTTPVQTTEQVEPIDDLPATPNLDATVEDGQCVDGLPASLSTLLSTRVEPTWKAVTMNSGKKRKSKKTSKPAKDVKMLAIYEKFGGGEALMPGDKAEDADDTVVAAVEEVPSEKKKPRKRGKKGGKRAKKPAKVSQGGRSPLEKSSVALLFALLVFLGGAWIFV